MKNFTSVARTCSRPLYLFQIEQKPSTDASINRSQPVPGNYSILA